MCVSGEGDTCLSSRYPTSWKNVYAPVEGDHLAPTSPTESCAQWRVPFHGRQTVCTQTMSTKTAKNTTAAQTPAPTAKGIDPAILAIFNSAIGILGSKLVLDQHIGRQVELSIIGDGVLLERGAYLYNTNVTTETRLGKAIDMLSPEEFFNVVTTEEEATKLTREALNIASVSFSNQLGKERLSHGELIVAQVQEYDSKATGNTEIGLRFVRKAQAVVLSRSSNSGLSKLREFAKTANDPFED